ncbi:hypothetical protein [Sphingomonas colocasiae]|uniref:Uncharacterized protein n=1 Tax=Sphingomonas colocasiae TaxID=1848973 RepID=A0ABS7PV65_9SPHN|nr:hypothetical protein [Sphingomonas colocasiae]MBY8825046.1 hypothetical protein [Sphingomonas colocasiae]
MTGARHDPDVPPAMLALPEGDAVRVASEAELRAALKTLSRTGSGGTIMLSRGPQDHVRATRRGETWSAVARRGGWWTSTTFTASMTTDHGARRARESRAAGTIWRRIAAAITAPPPEYALSTAQVETILVDYLRGGRFSIPVSGA